MFMRNSISHTDRSHQIRDELARLYIEQNDFYRDSARANHTETESAQYERRRKRILELFAELDGLRKAA